MAYVESGYVNASANVNFWGSTNTGYIQTTPDDAVRVLVENAQKIGAYDKRKDKISTSMGMRV